MPIRPITARMPLASGRSVFLLLLALAGACQMSGPSESSPAPEPTAEERERARAEAQARTTLDQAERALELPDPQAALNRLVALDRGLPVDLQERARELARGAVAALSPEDVAQVAESLPPETAVAGVVLARHARLLGATGDVQAAREAARAALESGANGPDSVTAATLLDPEAEPLPPLEGMTRTARIAGVLSTSGSPSLQEYSRLVAEGIEVAAVSREGGGRAYEVLLRDDEGNATAAAQAVREVADEGALGAVGFIRDEALASAAQALADGFPLISTSARNARQAGPGAYSLAGADPVAAASLGAWAAEQGYARVAILHSQAAESVEEADAVQQALQERGTPVVGRYAYPARATFFQDQIRAAREVLRLQEIRSMNLSEEDTLFVEELDPVALMVPIPSEDVEYVAPQLTFFGLDTLGIDILGTSGWTDPQTFEVVDDRHTEGVVATAAVSAGPGAPGYRRFREAYEAHFQRTLVSSVPALGYDAALLLLEAIGQGAATPAQVRQALEAIDGLQGATGILSVVDGRILRRQDVVRIVNGGTIPTP